MKRRHHEPTPEEIRAATPEPPKWFEPDPEADEAFRRLCARTDPPERIIEYDGEPLPEYD